METIFDAHCPTRAIFEDISKKWVALVVILLSEKPLRFSELLAGASGVSQKVLTQTVRTLERNGIVSRTVDSRTVPITVVYALTTLGESLVAPIQTMQGWTERHRDEVYEAQHVYDLSKTSLERG